jgi:hypothetical protein
MWTHDKLHAVPPVARRRKRLAIPFALFGAASLGLGAWSVTSSVNSTRPNVSKGLVAVPGQVEVIDMSEQGDRKRESTLRLLNESVATIRILGTEAACGCTTLGEPTPSILKPGESAELRISVDIPSYGAKNTHIEIHTDFPGNPVLTVPLVLTGPPHPVPYVRGRLMPLQFFVEERNPPPPQTLQVTTVEGARTAKWIDSFASPKGVFLVTERTMTEKPGPGEGTVERTYSYEISVSQNALRSPEASDSLEPVLRYQARQPPNSISASVTRVARMKISPDSIYISSGGSLPVERMVIIYANDPGNELVIVPDKTSIPNWIEVLPVAAAVSPTASDIGAQGPRRQIVSRFMIRIAGAPPDSDSTANFSRAKLVFRTSDPSYPELSTLVVVASRSQNSRVGND